MFNDADNFIKLLGEMSELTKKAQLGKLISALGRPRVLSGSLKH